MIVMIALPVPTALIVPFSTLTTLSLLEVYVRFPAAAGVKVAEIVLISQVFYLLRLFQ